MLQAGDVVLFLESPTFFSRLVALAQWLRRVDRPYRRYTHAAIAIDRNLIVEAVGTGVRRRKVLACEMQGKALVCRLYLSARQKNAIVEYAVARIGEPYGKLQIAAIALRLLTGLTVDLTGHDSEICSELVAECLWQAGLRLFPDPAQVMPADLASVLYKYRLSTEERKIC